MKLEEVLDTYFKEFLELDVGGVNGRKFKCKSYSSDFIFIKAREKKDWDWFDWGLRKEYKICQELGEKISYVPKSRLSMESDNYIIVGFDFIENDSEIRYRNLYQSKNIIEPILYSFNEVLNWLYNNSETISTSIDNMRGREQIAKERSFKTMKDYIIGERLREKVYYGNKMYDEYENHMNDAANLLDDMYSKERERLIHGDIQNTNNVIYSTNGIKAIVDWEISGWFDYLYDVAFIESMYIDKPCKFSDTLQKENLRPILYDGLDIDEKKREIIKLYKIWPNYLEIENLYNKDRVYGKFTLKNERKKQKEILDGIINEAI